MKTEILKNLNAPKQLEKIYRSNKAAFKREFTLLYPELKGNVLADSWNERLNYDSEDINWGTKSQLLIVISASLLAGLIAKIPAIFGVDEEFFFPRNIGFIIFPLLTAFFAWKNRLSSGKTLFILAAMLMAVLFINLFPDVKKSDTLTLSCIHLLLFLWSVLGFSYAGGIKNDPEKRLGFLKYNGDLIVMTALILLAGGLMSAITVGLFSLIGLKIEEFYFNYVGVFGLSAAPLIATHLTQTNPQLVGRVSPVIAKIFSPLVVVMLVIYLGAIVYSGKDPYNDREFLMVFNALLIGVMAIIFFSVAESTATKENRTQIWILFLLSALTIIVNSIAFSAIIYRISEFGFTPNRTAVLGGNLLILLNLILVTLKLLRVISNQTELSSVGKTIATYLPVYFFWTVIVTFFFPLIFGFR